VANALTVGVIGLGFGRAHIPAFQANGCQVVAVCQRDEASARKVADQYGVTQIFTRWEDLLDRARPDIVAITTPPHLHHAIALRAFAGGAHVLCEKPLAMDRREGDAMVEAAHRARRIAMTNFNWRFPSAMLELNRRLGDRAVGRVLHAGVRWFGGRYADESAAPTWRMDRAQAGVGALGDVGVHVIDLVRWNLGEFRRVLAHIAVVYPSRGGQASDTDDVATIVGELASGVAVTIQVSRVARGVADQTFDVYGSDGALFYRLDRDRPGWWNAELRAAAATGPAQPVDVPGADPGTKDPMEIIGKTMIGPLVARLLEAIRSGKSASPSLDDGLRAQAVLESVLESAARGAWVTVPGTSA
jgi:predicted dehydrogenase